MLRFRTFGFDRFDTASPIREGRWPTQGSGGDGVMSIDRSLTDENRKTLDRMLDDMVRLMSDVAAGPVDEERRAMLGIGIEFGMMAANIWPRWATMALAARRERNEQHSIETHRLTADTLKAFNMEGRPIGREN